MERKAMYKVRQGNGPKPAPDNGQQQPQKAATDKKADKVTNEGDKNVATN